MNAIVQFLVKHGYFVLFAAIFARQIGLPVPAPLFLLAAGALVGAGKLGLVGALGLTSLPVCWLIGSGTRRVAGGAMGCCTSLMASRQTQPPPSAGRKRLLLGIGLGFW
jgi:hypothetical protein